MSRARKNLLRVLAHNSESNKIESRMDEEGGGAGKGLHTVPEGLGSGFAGGT